MSRRVSFPVWSVGLLSVVLVNSPIAALPQAGSPRPGQPGMQSGPPPVVVLGRVVDGDTGQPVGGAVVQLGTAGPPPALTAAMEAGLEAPPPRAAGAQQQFVIADANGRFVFRDVRPGSYPLTARIPGYLVGSYGALRPQGAADRLEVPASRPVTEATIRIWRYASINGTVRDEAGEPAVGVGVRVLRVAMTGGRRRLTASVSATTDDRGAYRLANLPPGQYLVFVPSTTTSVPVATVDWYTQARAEAGASTELLQSFRESRAPTPTATGLRVDDHVVTVSSLRNSTSPSIGPDGRLSIYRTIYHPSTFTPGRAEPIVVTSGEEREGIDLRLMLEPASRISGEVLGPDGPAANLGVRLIHQDSAEFSTDVGLETSVTATSPEGRFTLLGVPPGQYTIEILRMPRPPLNTTMTTVISTGGGGLVMSSTSAVDTTPETPDAPTLWASQAVTVGGEDVSGLTLRLAEGLRVSGNVEFEGAAAPPPDLMQRVRVTLTPASGQRLAAIVTPGSVAADGTFRTVGYPPGRYFVSASAPVVGGAARWTLKSAEVGGRDALDRALELEADDIGGVVLRFTDRVAGITGTVQVRPGEEPEALVLVFPADHRAWVSNGMPARRARSVRTGAQGSFSISGIPPGSYLAVAVPPATDVDLQDPAEVAALARHGTPVEVLEGSEQRVTLSIATIR